MTEAQFKNLKIGNKVRVKSDLVVGCKYDGIHFPIHMKKYSGKIVTVEYKGISFSNHPYVYCSYGESRITYSYNKYMIDSHFIFGR